MEAPHHGEERHHGRARGSEERSRWGDKGDSGAASCGRRRAAASRGRKGTAASGLQQMSVFAQGLRAVPQPSLSTAREEVSAFSFATVSVAGLATVSVVNLYCCDCFGCFGDCFGCFGDRFGCFGAAVSVASFAVVAACCVEAVSASWRGYSPNCVTRGTLKCLSALSRKKKKPTNSTIYDNKRKH